jgi:Putative zinc-finger
MQCPEFEDRLQSLLDSRLAPEHDSQLRTHAATCESCERLLLAQQQLFGALRQSATPNSTANNLAANIVRQHTEQRAEQLRFRRQLGWGLAFTSALAISWLVISQRIALSPTTPLEQQLVVQPQPNSSPPTPHMASQHAPARFDRRKTEEKLGQYREAIVSLAHQIGESSELDHVGATLEPGLRPLQSSFGLAIDALRRTLPRSREERESRPRDGAYKLDDLRVLI